MVEREKRAKKPKQSKSMDWVVHRHRLKPVLLESSRKLQKTKNSMEWTQDIALANRSAISIPSGKLFIIIFSNVIRELIMTSTSYKFHHLTLHRNAIRNIALSF